MSWVFLVVLDIVSSDLRQKDSDLYIHDDLYVHEKDQYVYDKGLYVHNKDLYIHKKDLHVHERTYISMNSTSHDRDHCYEKYLYDHQQPVWSTYMVAQ